MRAREFAYWLQGYFEINGASDALDVRQAKQILSKLEKVDTTGGDVSEQKAAAYVNFAKGALSSVEFISAEDQPKVLTGVTTKLRADLNDLFLHAQTFAPTH